MLLLLLLTLVVPATLYGRPPGDTAKTEPPPAEARSAHGLERRVEELVGEEDEPNVPRPVAANLTRWMALFDTLNSGFGYFAVKLQINSWCCMSHPSWCSGRVFKREE